MGSLTIKDPIIITASFWTLYNRNSNKLSIIFKYPTRANLYKEIEEEIKFLNFSELVNQGHYLLSFYGVGEMYNRITTKFSSCFYYFTTDFVVYSTKCFNNEIGGLCSELRIRLFYIHQA